MVKILIFFNIFFFFCVVKVSLGPSLGFEDDFSDNLARLTAADNIVRCSQTPRIHGSPWICSDGELFAGL